jgi:hypothetical protein
MNTDEIIKLARQAGYSVDMFGFGIWDSAEFNRFANLVAQHEREACAKLCEQHGSDYYCEHITDSISQKIMARQESK